VLRGKALFLRRLFCLGFRDLGGIIYRKGGRMKIEAKNFKWVFLSLYAVIIVGLLSLSFFKHKFELPFWIPTFSGLRGNLGAILAVLLATFLSQFLFIFGAGRINLCKPVKKQRLIIPITIAAVMLSVLGLCFIIPLVELFRINVDNWWTEETNTLVCYTILGISWLVWGVYFFIKLRNASRYKATASLLSLVAVSNILQLLVALVAHYLVRRRGECLAGILTSIGIIGGVIVMLWSFGPVILFLFLREKYKLENRQ